MRGTTVPPPSIITEELEDNPNLSPIAEDSPVHNVNRIKAESNVSSVNHGDPGSLVNADSNSSLQIIG